MQVKHLRKKLYHIFKKNKVFYSLLLLAIIVIPITGIIVHEQQILTQHAAGTGVFHVEGTKIIDPSGNPFIVKGIDAIYGRFAGGDQNGYGLTNYNNAQRDLDYLKSQGVNLIRLSVSADAATPGNAWNIPNYMTDLDTAVNWITSRGLVAELSQGETEDPAVAATFLGQLAAKYKDNHLVWIKADNEPFCITQNQAHCYDWSYWQQKHQLYIQSIRSNGYTGPIVINCLSWSWDCSKIAQYPLNDSNLIYGAHMYSNGSSSFWNSPNAGPQVADTMWANLSTQFPMIVDETGSLGGAQLQWNSEFLDYTVNWVQNRGGNGVIAFVHRWSDADNMSDETGHWFGWGQIFYDHYLTKVGGPAVSIPAYATATPTTITPTPVLGAYGIYRPYDVTVVGTKVWVANSGNDTISIFNSNGTFTGTILSGNGLNAPIGISVINGKVWVANSGNNTISIFNTDGSASGIGPFGSGLSQPREMALVGSQVWVTDGGGAVSLLNTDGTVAGTALTGNNIYGPAGIAVVNGKVWIANSSNSSISLFNPDGSVAGTPITGNGLNDPVGLKIVGSQVWVVNYLGGNISIFNFDGTAAGVGPYSGNGLVGPGGLGVVGSNVWVTNYNNTISVFNTDGTAGTPLPTQAPSNKTATISVSPVNGTATIGTPFTVNVLVNGEGQAFNAAQATVSVSSNLSITNISAPTSNGCNFTYVSGQTPSTSNPSFAGAILSSSITSCTVYIMTLTPNTSGTGTITISNGSVKAYSDNSEILSATTNGSYTISTNVASTPTNMPTPIPFTQTPTPTTTPLPATQTPTLTAASVQSPSITNIVTDTYQQTITVTGTKATSVNSVYVNNSTSGVTYPTNTTWQYPLILTLGNNTITIYGKDGNGTQSSPQTITVTLHKMSDIDGNGTIDLTDLSLFGADWGKSANLTNKLSDMNGDGIVDLTDFSILAKQFGQ